MSQYTCHNKHVMVGRFDAMIDDLHQGSKKGIKCYVPGKVNPFTLCIAQYEIRCKLLCDKAGKHPGKQTAS